MDSPMDKIFIRNLKAETIIGTLPSERLEAQTVLINIELELNLAAAGKSDSLNDTVDYAALEKSVIEAVRKAKFYLLERLAGEVAAVCLRFSRIVRVIVTVDKPGALKYSNSVAVRIERSRH